jgi:hypothetical protein
LTKLGQAVVTSASLCECRGFEKQLGHGALNAGEYSDHITIIKSECARRKKFKVAQVAAARNLPTLPCARDTTIQNKSAWPRLSDQSISHRKKRYSSSQREKEYRVSQKISIIKKLRESCATGPAALQRFIDESTGKATSLVDALYENEFARSQTRISPAASRLSHA